MSDLQKHIQELLHDDPEFAKAWEESDVEYQITRQIVALRVNRGLTQKEFAEKLGTKQSTIARIENGNQNITVKTLSHMAKVLGARVKIEIKPNS